MHTSKSLQMKHFEISNLASFPVCPWSHTWPWYGLSLRNINGKLDHGFKLQFLKRRLIGSMPNCYPLQELWSVMLVIKREDWSGSSGLESGRCVCWSIDNRLQLSETPQRSVFFWKNMYHDRYGTVTGPLRDRYGTVTGVPLISVNVAIFPLKSATKAISVKFPLKSTVTGPLGPSLHCMWSPFGPH